MTKQVGVSVQRNPQPVGWISFPPASGQVTVQSNNYWSGLEFAPNTNNAWNFNFNSATAARSWATRAATCSPGLLAPDRAFVNAHMMPLGGIVMLRMLQCEN